MEQETALSIIAYCQLFATIVVILLMAALIYLVLTVKKILETKVDEAMEKINPILEQTKSVVEQAKSTIETVSERVDAVTNKAQNTSTKVGDTIQHISGRFDNALTPKIAVALGVAGGALRLFQLYSSLKKKTRKKK